jgi:hypothetical protein
LVAPTISPCKESGTVHLIADPVTCEFTTVSPFVFSVSMNIIV